MRIARIQAGILLTLVGCTITGTVQDETGQPLEGVALYLTSDKTGETRIAITNQSGDFQFTSVEFGRYILRPGNFGKSDPLFSEIEAKAFSGTPVRFTIKNVTRIGLSCSTGNVLALFIGRDLTQLYREAIRENGGVVAPLYEYETTASREKKLETIHGLLLPGGIDVDPSFYGETPHPSLEGTDRSLDLLEFNLLENSESRGIPILGICRGLQVINVFHGGTLYQDIPSQFQGVSVVKHREKKQGVVYHDIFITPETRFFWIIDKRKLIVDSSHHQAVKELAPGFIISAVSPEDGLIEGIEAEGDAWVMGLQFHPEKLRREEETFNRLFETFMDEAHRYQAHTANESIADPYPFPLIEKEEPAHALDR